MSTPDIAQEDPAKIIGLRANAFAAVVMLLVEYALGVGVNLYATLPSSDHGKGLLPAFLGAVTGGPVLLTIHALLGTLLLATGITAVVRATLVRRTWLIAVASVALLSIVVAWVTGTRFVGDAGNGVSLVMGLAAGVALLSYATILFAVTNISSGTSQD